MRKTILSLFFLVLLPSFILGQGTFRIKGKVTDAKTGEPLIGASVVLKPGNVGAASDLDGNYTFEVSGSLAKNQTGELTASFVNYKKQSVKVTLDGKDITQNFVLKEDVFQNEEIVVTGIASKTSKSVAEIAVGRVSAADLQQINTYGSLSQLVQGKVSGVQLTTSSGNVGSGWRFYVRGGGGLNGDGQPTIYVDGVRIDNTEFIGYAVGGQGISTLSNLNTNDIEKIEFLKGPAAAAMYGTSGSNGVVLITSKSGKLRGSANLPISVDYKYNYGFNEKIYKYKSEDFLSFNDANSNFQRGPIQEHNLSVAGGFSTLKYFASYENRNEDGILPSTSGKRNSLRLKLNAVPTEKLTVVFSGSYTTSDLRRPNNDNIIYGFLGNTLIYPESYAFLAKNSMYAFEDRHKIKTFLGSINANYAPIENLEVFGSVGLENTDYNQQRLSPYGYDFGGLIGTKGEKAIFQRNNTSYTYDFNAKYRYKIFDDINVTSIVGGQFFDKAVSSTNIVGQQFGTNYITSIGSAGSITGYGEASSNTREGGIFTEHNLNYLDQYFLTLAIRRDYSSVFGTQAPGVTYPKASFALRLDKYDFLPSFFNLAKIRAAYGENGQLPGLLDGTPYIWATEKGGYGGGAVLSSLGNSAIEPERIKEIEIGFDTELFNQISLELSYYKQYAKNSIVGFPLSSSTGKTASSLPFNVGALENSGLESLIQYHPIRSSEYDLELDLIWNYQSNKITDLGGAQPIYAGFNSSNTIQPNLPRSEFYSFEVLGALFDANGKYAGVKTSTDRISLGNPIPKHTGSFTVNFKFLKNFTLYVATEFALNFQMYNYTKAFGANTGNNPDVNRYRAMLGLSELYPGVAPKDITPFTPNTPDYVATANKLAKVNGSYVANYIEDADYFTVRELSFSYDFTDLMNEYGLSGYLKYISAGFSVRNLLRFTKYSGSDVEINAFGARSVARGTDFLTLQTPRTVNFWVRFGF